MSNNINENIDNSYLFGCVKYKNEFSFYLMPIAYWVLNYIKYDPRCSLSDWGTNGHIFRDNVLNVDDDNIEPFIKSIQVDIIDIDSLSMADYRFMDIFLFYIDFDSKTFISYFDDIDVEEYIPNLWTGKFEDPINYLPENLIKKVFPYYVKGYERSII